MRSRGWPQVRQLVWPKKSVVIRLIFATAATYAVAQVISPSDVSKPITTRFGWRFCVPYDLPQLVSGIDHSSSPVL
jgi:hypothetical protein